MSRSIVLTLRDIPICWRTDFSIKCGESAIVAVKLYRVSKWVPKLPAVLRKIQTSRKVLINSGPRKCRLQEGVKSVQPNSEARLIPVQLPWGERLEFKGVIDLLSMKAYKGTGKEAEEVPAELKAEAEAARTQLVEAAAEGDDTLLEKYLDSGELSAEEIAKGFASVVKHGTYVPVFVAAGGAEIGIGPLLDGIISLFPSPAEAVNITVPARTVKRY